MITILGGGPGGYTAAIRAAQLGAEVTLIEREEVGGTCLNWGCVPSKVFLKGSKMYSQLKFAESYGVFAKPSPFDMKRLGERKDEAKQALVMGLKNVLRSYGVNIVHGEGRMVDEHTVARPGGNIDCEKIILATGCQPEVPHLFQELSVTYKEVFQLQYLPRSVLVVHGGVFAVEMAWFFLELGSQVTMVAGNLLEKDFEDIETRIASYLKNRGVKFVQGRIASIKKQGEQKLVEIGEEEIIAEELIWMNRKPVLEGIPQRLVKNGRVAVNEYMQTAIPTVYAVGDITGSYTAGDAMAQGVVAAEHAAGNAVAYDYKTVPKVLYAPEAAVIGLTEREASERYDVVKGNFPYGASGRAQTVGALRGRVTVLADRKYGEILGAHIVGKGASELIQLIGFAMRLEATIDELSSLLCAHPTMVEMIRDAGLDIHGNAFNLPRK
ncbi:MAG: NAD(P)/FAD-dependent oxidoreductase [Theionarchaea archaeon]|nr:NAD(P)/FAD-dependent oxidoreductase [Theionarchaea archaeon]MBU7001996.1 NAD(P)/FAD-dependent oxidoreductase [Theionarchaea archaeon]MBU7019753.1 NAD(P)/FAD-dependent oxidoreductase [Theionarchaea archaeon]MBU7034627.1 NAD(P)/FAD-dependent oxidoreductase [Theionarchaea archaeon]MBU7040616.1 NAD(P)/FAD-dependent oxidoreductase [Theionarchaea archaeon]